MRRVGDLWPQVIRFESLLRAARVASKGKRETVAAARFLERAEFECLALQRELETGAWRPGRPARFPILDPKPRTITAVPFRDQVVHHALMSALAPVLERRMIADSYACRSGKGTHAALRRARAFVRSHDWFLKLDVRAFFESVRHDVVLDCLGRCVKDRRVLDLCATVLRGPPADEGTDVGLPIGALTSQWFANLVLDRLDHHVKEILRVPAYLRYMDDFALFSDDRARLHAACAEVASFLAAPLGLRLKERATVLAPVTEGLPFLGWLVFRGVTRLRPENRRRYHWRLRARRREFETGRRSATAYRQSVASVYELLRAGDTYGLRVRWSSADSSDP